MCVCARACVRARVFSCVCVFVCVSIIGMRASSTGTREFELKSSDLERQNAEDQRLMEALMHELEEKKVRGGEEGRRGGG